jgi:regulator of RNase E activity RraA
MTRKRKTILAAGALLAAIACQRVAETTAEAADPLIDGFRKTTVASVSDAVDQVVGVRGYLSHDVRPFVTGRVVGRARTSLVRPATKEQASPTLAVKHSVEMIDSAQPGEVGVIVMEGTRDVAAIGGLMGTAAKARGMAGMVLDGGVRDIAELRSLGLPVYARSASPATAVSRYASVAKDIEVECAGVKVRPGDIVVADEDGVVIVPKDKAEAVLKAAEDIDKRESAMAPIIKELKSLTQAIAKFNRI